MADDGAGDDVTTDRMVQCPICEEIITVLTFADDSPPPPGYEFHCPKCGQHLALTGEPGFPGVRTASRRKSEER